MSMHLCLILIAKSGLLFRLLMPGGARRTASFPHLTRRLRGAEADGGGRRGAAYRRKKGPCGREREKERERESTRGRALGTRREALSPPDLALSLLEPTAISSTLSARWWA